MGWRPFDNGSYYSYTKNPLVCSGFAGPVTWSCWVRFWAGVTGTDEWIFGNGVWSFARQTGTNTLYSHIASGGNSFVNNGAIGADPGSWHHLLGLLDNPPNFLHAFYVDGAGASAGTTLVNSGGANEALFSYDSFIEVAHAACWNVAFSAAEAAMAYKYDPLTFKPNYLRGYWPLSRGVGQRQCAPGVPYGTGDAMYTSTSGTPALLTDDGPPTAINWGSLEIPGTVPPLGSLAAQPAQQLTAMHGGGMGKW
jgi:hypothetical protein